MATNATTTTTTTTTTTSEQNANFTPVSNESLNYDDAKLACNNMNMKLAMPRTQEQYDQVIEMAIVSRKSSTNLSCKHFCKSWDQY